MIKKLTIPVDHGNRNMKTTHFFLPQGFLPQTASRQAGRISFRLTGNIMF